MIFDSSFIARFEAKVKRTTSCHLWQGATIQGYGSLGAQGKSYKAHRVAWELHHGKRIPEGSVIMHTCDVRNCVNPEHLKMGTQKDNVEDMLNKGRCVRAKGTAHGRARVDEEIVRYIRHSPLSLAKLAAELSIGRSTVHHIRKGNTWKHVL